MMEPSGMNKRKFLKTSGLFIAGSVLARLASGEENAAARKNWAGNYEYRARRLHVPKTLEEVQTIAKDSRKLKALGARHSFNAIADSDESQISLKNLDRMTLDPESRTVTVGAGLTYGQLALYLEFRGYAVHNLASLPHVSVAGACSTATHGSGSRNGNLATAVHGLELVTAEGDVVRLAREKDGEQFQGAVVALGCLGVVTCVTLEVEPAFTVKQFVYENLPLAQLETHFEDIFASGYSVSLFTDWQNQRITQVWIKRRLDQEASAEIEPEFFGAKLATKKLHPLAGYPAENCTEQMGIPGPWYERLPHFRMEFARSSGEELQSEYFVPRARGYEAIRAVERLREHVTPHLFVSELRTIDADGLWMSPCYQRPSLAIHFTWKPDWPAVRKLLPRIEAELEPFDARPHWGKLFTTPHARLRSLYEKLPDFQKLLEHYDPRGKFRNEFLNATIFGG